MTRKRRKTRSRQGRCAVESRCSVGADRARQRRSRRYSHTTYSMRMAIDPEIANIIRDRINYEETHPFSTARKRREKLT